MRAKSSVTFAVTVIISLCLLCIHGCGGKGSPDSAYVPAGATGYGKVAAVVKLTPPAGRVADANGAATVTVTISISGVYGANHKEFKPVTTTMAVNIAAGPAKVSMLDVPIGVNHLLTVDADWGGATDTVKTIIPEVRVGETATAVANQASTVVADTAMFTARQQGKALYEVSQDEILRIQMTVDNMAANGIPYSLMAPDKVLGFMKNMGAPTGIVITPASATVAVGGPLQFMALVMDANGLPVPGATASWEFSAPAVGNISPAGLFTGTASGTGVVTASFATLTATAPVTVITICSNNSVCNDNNPLTVDLCQNPGALNAQCVHNAIACAVNADCNDNNPQTTDTCVGGGAAGATCSHTQIVNQPPTASATANVVSGVAPLTVNFTGGCSDPDGTCASYQWNFGDGSATDAAQNPSHIYAASGTFTATLTVTDNQGSAALNTVHITVAGNQAPAGTIAANVANGIAPLGVNFTGGCADADGTCVSYLWNFGDGSPTNSSQSPGHTYTATGTFTVTLTVTDNLGAATQQTLTITTTAANQLPAATSLNASPGGGAAPLLVNFSAACNDPDGTCASYLWDFGDGATSPLQTPGHTYIATGTFNALLTVMDNSGGTATGAVTVTVSAANIPPVASAAANIVSGVAPLAVNFTGTCSDPDGSCASYAWNFGDGSATDTTQNPSHTFTATGSFNVILTVTDNLGATSQSVRNISVGTNQLPTGSIIASPATGTAPLPVNFTGGCADPDGTCVSYMWNFGDGSPTVSTQTPSHTYAAGGAFTVTLTVTDNLGASSQNTFIINVNNKPVATASSNVSNGIAPLAVNFTGGCVDSDGTCASYSWDFGDGATSTTQNPSHTYTATGTFTAVLSVKDNLNAMATSAVTITVVANQPPVAAAASNVVNGIAPLTVNFTGGCTDADGTCVSYSWNFMDGSATNTTQNPSHTFTATGSFNVVLTVTDNLGATSQSVRNISVGTNQLPTGSIIASPATGTAPLPVNFTGNCSDPDGTCVSYMWNFGDGSPTVSTQNASHTYATGGAFTVTFTVTDNLGAATSSTTIINVNSKPVASASANFTSGIAPLAVNFTGGCTDPDGTCVSYSWVFGDGSATSTIQNATHTYTATGTFAAELKVTDNSGAWATSAVTITVAANQPPVASATSNIISGIAPLAVNFTGGCTDSDGTCASYSWNFGDGSATNTTQNPSHTYTAAGTFNAVLTVTDNLGLSAQSVRVITVAANQLPVATATASPASGTVPLPVNFTGGCTDPDGTCASYSWNFGDGAPTASTLNASHTYTATGTFTVSFTVTDNNGATGVSTASISVVAAGGVSKIAVGYASTYILTNAGGVKSWGQNNIGQLGNGDTIDKSTAVDVLGLTSGVSYVSSGIQANTCALTTAGGLKCWGLNGYGELGDGTSTNRTTPVDVVGLTSGVSSVSANGYEHTCALTTAGGVKCWGRNQYGQLGNGTTTNSLTPVDVTGLTSGVVAVGAFGNGHSCAITTAGGLKCWGYNGNGELGDGTVIQRLTPVDVTGLTSGVVAVDAGYAFTCALTASGGVKCWGGGASGELGNSASTNSLTPVDVTGLTSGVAAISANWFHTCALTTAGGMKCWGQNVGGVLGDGTIINRASPVDVTGLTSGVAAISAGTYYTCALMTSGGMKCWGSNAAYGLGDGTTTERHTPVDVIAY